MEKSIVNVKVSEFIENNYLRPRHLNILDFDVDEASVFFNNGRLEDLI